jgi:hypothetical protein
MSEISKKKCTSSLMTSIIFLLSLIVLYFGWFYLGAFLFVITLIRWELAEDEIMYKRMKEEGEREAKEINDRAERKIIEAEQDKELQNFLSELHVPELPYEKTMYKIRGYSPPK